MDTLTNNKRIAKNTLALYFRMLLTLAIKLYISRVILDTLGVEDYGIYNVIGGVVLLFSIFSGSLSVAISRYITVELGKENIEKLKNIFSTSVNIQVLMSVIICILAEIAGIWFINEKLQIPPERIYAAHWILQFAIITFVIGLVSVPYNATIIAHEQMSAFAYISILEAALNLLAAYLLYISPFDKLIIYAVLLCMISATIRMVYGIYCKRHFEETHYRFIFDKKLLQEMTGFIGWAFWGNGVVVLKDQGTNILLNIYCGPVVNAARGIAIQVNTAVYSLVNNFLMAVNPQITKSYAGGEIKYMHKLIIKSGKLTFLVLTLFFFPLYANLDTILSLWLVEVPEHTNTFIILMLMYSLLDCFGSPMVTGVLAEGHIKRYEINLTLLYIANFLTAYFILKWRYEPEWVFVSIVVFKALVIGALLWQSKVRYKFPIREFLLQSALRSLIVFIMGTTFIHLLKDRFEQINFIASSGIIFIFMALIIYFLGLTKNEAQFIKKHLSERVKQYKR